MKRISLIALPVALIVSSTTIFAQNPDDQYETRPRVVSGANATQQQRTIGQSDRGQASPEQVPDNKATAVPGGAEAARDARNPLTYLSPSLIHSKIGEAERLLKSRPLATAMTPSIEFVTLAALDRTNSRIHLITLSKQSFLTKGTEVTLASSLGAPLNVRILRANGVNTAVTIFDDKGRALTPLVVEFPIEKNGAFREMAYYTSAHPALLSSGLVNSGQVYVRTMIDLATKRLREKGVFISPQIVNVAERLCLVEHVDHDRFRLENRSALFDEIYSLYALNELNTYRYSVSAAGAGGMVQMIPWAYNLIRQRHPGVGLIPDFVTGMRNHANALEAMLLYMQDTWNDLAANEDVRDALDGKLATQTELLAAGYNSNAAKLPLYLRRGGVQWRTQIPRETQMYLQIYKTFEGLVPLKTRSATLAEPAK